MQKKFTQPDEMATILRELQQKDSYNKFCIDCNKNDSTHASVTFGIFLCEPCAMLHWNELGMDHSYIKSIYDDLWDEF